ncbi:uncharacterized protein LOC116949565 [Petromyzon marinus]|uniref:Uncharacterized protein LOC116949565 n=1 Tax=Petromyzon marinus TaxID=7757 RepID=A0AAJ7TRI6_PETMA|nr:uncharacterized protein LOC116949565 [Petromyzon marinus]
MNSFLRDLLDPTHGDVFESLTAVPTVWRQDKQPHSVIPVARSHPANVGMPASFIPKSCGWLPYPTYVSPAVRRFVEEDRQRLSKLGDAPGQHALSSQGKPRLCHVRPGKAQHQSKEQQQHRTSACAEQNSQSLGRAARDPWRSGIEDVTSKVGAGRGPTGERTRTDVDSESVSTFRTDSISILCPSRGSVRSGHDGFASSSEVARRGGSVNVYVSSTPILFCSRPGRASYPMQRSLDTHGTQLSRRSTVTRASHVA